MSLLLALFICLTNLAGNFQAVVPTKKGYMEYGATIEPVKIEKNGSKGFYIKFCRFIPGAKSDTEDCKTFPEDIGNDNGAFGRSLFKGSQQDWHRFFDQCSSFRMQNNAISGIALATSLAVPGGQGVTVGAIGRAGHATYNAALHAATRVAIEQGYRKSLAVASENIKRYAAGRAAATFLNSRAVRIAGRVGAATLDENLYTSTMGTAYPDISPDYVDQVRGLVLPNKSNEPNVSQMNESETLIHYKDAESLADVLSTCSYNFYDVLVRRGRSKCLQGCHGSGQEENSDLAVR